MKKIYRLKSWVKTFLILVLLESIMITYLFICASRIEKIEKEENEIVNIQILGD